MSKNINTGLNINPLTGDTNSLVVDTTSLVVTNGGSTGIGTINPNSKFEIVSNGSTSTTKGLSLKNSSLVEKFYVRDDGMVSATDGYSINGTLFLHNTFGGIQHANKNNTFLGLMTPIAAGGTGSAGTNNTAIGSVSMQTLTTGFGNTAVGHGSLNKITIGRDNVAIGQFALFSLTSTIQSNESWNTAIGKDSFTNLLTGVYNVGLGLKSGANITSGAGNTCLGYLAGASSSGTYNHSIAIGRLARFNASNQMVVGNQSSGAYINEVIWGAGIEQGSGINPLSFTQKITNISAGTLDTPTDYDFIFQSSAGTGAGLGGKFIFKVAPAGATGTTQNAFVDAMTIQQDGVVVYRSFLKASLPTPVAGGMIRVSDEIGGDTLAYSDGINWKRISDGAIVA